MLETIHVAENSTQCSEIYYLVKEVYPKKSHKAITCIMYQLYHETRCCSFGGYVRYGLPSHIPEGVNKKTYKHTEKAHYASSRQRAREHIKYMVEEHWKPATLKKWEDYVDSKDRALHDREIAVAVEHYRLMRKLARIKYHEYTGQMYDEAKAGKRSLFDWEVKRLEKAGYVTTGLPRYT